MNASNETKEPETPKEEEIYDIFVKPEELKVRQPGGEVVTYLICETSGPAEYWKWMQELSALQKKMAKGEIADTNFYELVTRLLCQIVKGVDGQTVDKAIISGWGIALKDVAFEKAQRVNGMTAKEGKAAKNDSSDESQNTTGSSSPSESVAA